MTKPIKILVVEDEPDLSELLEFNLGREGYHVTCVETGEDALDAARREAPGVILLDLMLPGMDGLEVCRALKAYNKTRAIPIIMLTAKGEETDIVVGLEMGADDYLTKPFSVRVLLARVKAVLRRQKPDEAGDETSQERRIEKHGLVIDMDRHEVLAGDKRVDLTATEFKLLWFLMGHPGRVYTRGDVIEEIHGESFAVTERAIDVQVVALRRKLGKLGENIETVRGVGYRFKE